MSGKSLLPLARGQKEPEPRVVVTEGRASRGILWGRWRLVVHDKRRVRRRALRPGRRPRRTAERAHASHPDVVAEMKARLAAALANVPARPTPSRCRQRLYQSSTCVSPGRDALTTSPGALTLGDGTHGASVFVEPVGVPQEAIRVDGPKVDFSLDTAADGLVGFDLRVDPPGAPDRVEALPRRRALARPGDLQPARSGFPPSRPARASPATKRAPRSTPPRSRSSIRRAISGVFVTRDRPGDAVGRCARRAAETGAVEMQQMLQQWGYAAREPLRLARRPRKVLTPPTERRAFWARLRRDAPRRAFSAPI